MGCSVSEAWQNLRSGRDEKSSRRYHYHILQWHVPVRTSIAFKLTWVLWRMHKSKWMPAWWNNLPPTFHAGETVHCQPCYKYIFALQDICTCNIVFLPDTSYTSITRSSPWLLIPWLLCIAISSAAMILTVCKTASYTSMDICLLSIMNLKMQSFNAMEWCKMISLKYKVLRTFPTSGVMLVKRPVIWLWFSALNFYSNFTDQKYVKSGIWGFCQFKKKRHCGTMRFDSRVYQECFMCV